MIIEVPRQEHLGYGLVVDWLRVSGQGYGLVVKGEWSGVWVSG